MTEYHKTMNEYLKECPPSIVEKGVSYLNNLLTNEVKEDVARLYKINPETWWSPFHFDWGMRIRNLLRDNVCLDNSLPSGNWDDYYIQMIEISCGVREVG